MKKNTVETASMLDEQQELYSRYRSKYRLEMILKLYFFSGIFISLLGIAYFILIRYGDTLSSTERVAIIFIGSGLTISFATKFLIDYQMNRKLNFSSQFKTTLNYYELLSTLQELELAGKEILTKQGDNFNKLSIKEIIAHLHQNEIISFTDTIAINDAVKLRNSIIHNEHFIPQEIVSFYSKQLSTVISKIKLALANK